MRITISGATERHLINCAAGWGFTPDAKGVKDYLDQQASLGMLDQVRNSISGHDEDRVKLARISLLFTEDEEED